MDMWPTPDIDIDLKTYRPKIHRNKQATAFSGRTSPGTMARPRKIHHESMCLEIWMEMAEILYKYGEEEKIKMTMMSNMMVKMVMVVVTSKRASEHVANTLGGRVPTTSHLIR